MTVLICPVRPGDSNPELQYAVRSWEANLVMPDGLQLWTVGHCPSWLNPDHHIEGNFSKSVPLAVFDNVRIGAEHAHNTGHEEVVFMNDDFFCMDPSAGVLPVRRNQSLTQQCAQFPRDVGLWWPRSLLLTLDWLQGEGFPDPASYEAHRPLIASPGGMVSALHRWLDSPQGSRSESMPQWRTLYGVLNGIEAWPVKDSKLGTNSPGMGTAWVSTSDASWRRYGPPIMKRFQKPSRWER